MFKSVMNSLTTRDHRQTAMGSNGKLDRLSLSSINKGHDQQNHDEIEPDTLSNVASKFSDFSETNQHKKNASLSMKAGKRKLISMMKKLHLPMSNGSVTQNKRKTKHLHNDDRRASQIDTDNENDDDEEEDDDEAYTSAEEVCRKVSLSSNGKEGGGRRKLSCSIGSYSRRVQEVTEKSVYGQFKASDKKYILPEEQCDIPTFLQTKNCDSYLIEETRRLLKERYTKAPESFYDADYKRMLTDNWTVSRFLLRRRLDPKRTAKLMEECGRFRKQYKMSEVQLWEFPIEFHKAGGLFKYAPDRVGNVTMYMRVKMYRRVPEISDVFKAFILCVLEQCDVANNGRGTAVMFDLTGCGLQNVDLSFLSWLLSSFRNYCPKGVSYIIVYNLPWILNATCKLAMTWMSSSNKRALRFVYGDEIENFIERSNLPDYLNGECKLNYRAIPEGSKPAIEVCDRLDMTREQALKIRELFKEYLNDDKPSGEADETKSHYDDAKSDQELEQAPAGPATPAGPAIDLVTRASKFIAHA